MTRKQARLVKAVRNAIVDLETIENAFRGETVTPHNMAILNALIIARMVLTTWARHSGLE